LENGLDVSEEGEFGAQLNEEVEPLQGFQKSTGIKPSSQS